MSEGLLVLLHGYGSDPNVMRSLGLREDQIVLGGFSQGAILALEVGLRRSQAPGAILAYSGFLSGRRRLAEVTSRPSVILAHGQKDPIVPVAAHHITKAALERVGVQVTAHISPETAHSVDPAGLALAARAMHRLFSH